MDVFPFKSNFVYCMSYAFVQCGNLDCFIHKCWVCCAPDPLRVANWLSQCRKTEVMNLLESAGFSRSNPYYVVQQGKVCSFTSFTTRSTFLVHSND
jgi:hypothetical protein